MTALRNIMTTQMFSRSTKTKYSCKLCERTMLRSFFIFPITICPMGQYHRNRKYNSQNIISQLQLLNEIPFKVNAQTDETMTYEQMKWHLENQQTIFDQVIERSLAIQKQTSQNVTSEVSKLDQAARDFVSQAGSLNERILSQLKCSEEQSRKHGFRLLRLVVLIEVLHLISSVALLLWLR